MSQHATKAPGAAGKGRKKIKQLEVIVADVIRETPDTVTLILFTGNEELDYRPGHFLTIDPHQFHALDRFTRYLEDVKGRKESPRAYSLASSPHEKHLAITVKEEAYVSGVTKYPPLLSPLLVGRTSRGTRMVVTGFTGPFTLPDDIAQRVSHLYHICAGSGVVPNYSMIKYALAHHPDLKHTLIYTSKTWDDVIYRRGLEELVKTHPDRLRVVHALTREQDHRLIIGPVRKGRISEGLFHELIKEPGDGEFFVCGPGITTHDRERAAASGTTPEPRFMESVLEILGSMGISPERIHRESY